MNNLRSPLGKARGSGSAKTGTEHFIWQRITALALIPLVVWFMCSITQLATGNHASTAAWLADPVNAISCILFLIAMFFHGSLGVQVVIEDYVHNEPAKMMAIIMLKLACFAAAIAGIFAVLSIYFKG